MRRERSMPNPRANRVPTAEISSPGRDEAVSGTSRDREGAGNRIPAPSRSRLGYHFAPDHTPGVGATFTPPDTDLSREKYSVLAYTVRIACPTSKNSPSCSSFDGD